MRPVLEAPRSSTLGSVERGPFYAVEVRASALGTGGTIALGLVLGHLGGREAAATPLDPTARTS